MVTAMETTRPHKRIANQTRLAERWIRSATRRVGCAWIASVAGTAMKTRFARAALVSRSPPAQAARIARRMRSVPVTSAIASSASGTTIAGPLKFAVGTSALIRALLTRTAGQWTASAMWNRGSVLSVLLTRIVMIRNFAGPQESVPRGCARWEKPSVRGMISLRATRAGTGSLRSPVKMGVMLAPELAKARENVRPVMRVAPVIPTTPATMPSPA